MAGGRAKKAAPRLDIEAFIRREAGKDLLRFSTAGSVDDGKSTLIGRLLCDSKNIYKDQVASIRKASGRTVNDLAFDYALVTDGLKAEREQGITIDVAYRYFSTPQRKFIIADTPGHEQYTRNMATGASTANLAVILVDARKGVLPQSKRHAFIASLLGIPHMIVAVNKMDLVDYGREAFDAIQREFTLFAAKLMVPDLRFIPVSALKGDNLLRRSRRMPWYDGETLMHILETITIVNDRNLVDLRFPVQLVLRPDQDFRGYAGTVASGVIRPGDEVLVLPSMRSSRVRSVVTADGELKQAFPPQAVTVTLEDEIDISRGDMIVHRHNIPRVGRHFEAMVVWMSQAPLDPRKPYLIKQACRTTGTAVDKVLFKTDVATMRKSESATLGLNEIGRVVFTADRPLFLDTYQRNRSTGGFILIDIVSNATVACGMVIDREPAEQLPSRMEGPAREAVRLTERRSLVTARERAERLNQNPATIWLTGLVGAGKTRIAFELERRMFALGGFPVVLDGENLRLGLSRDLDFSQPDRTEHLRRAAEIARLMNDSGSVVICAFASPFAETRRAAAAIIGPGRFIEIFVSSPLDWCRRNDASGLYAKADKGEVQGFPGVQIPYEPPEEPALVLPYHELGAEESAIRVLDLLKKRGVFPASP